MATNCLNKNFATSEASTKAWMRTRDLIDEYLNVLDINGFREANQRWTKYAREEYGVEDMLFAEEAYKDKIKALPNKKAFKKIDRAKGIEYEQRSSEAERITKDEFEQQRQRIEAVTGWTVEYDRTIDQSATVQGNKIVANPDKLFQDTLVHEVGHVLIDSIGGLNNPMVRRGIEQLKGSDMANRVEREYSDKPQEIIDKEILATAIGMESVDIFNNGSDVSKWNRWLDLFFRRIKQVLGIERNIAKEMASEIIHHNPQMKPTDQQYERRDYETDTLQDEIDKIIANMRSEIAVLKRKQPENYEEKRNQLGKLVEHLENAYKDVAVSNYISIAEERVEEIQQRLNQDNLSVSELRQIREDMSPYENTEELQYRIKEIEWETSDLSREEVETRADNIVATLTRMENTYLQKARQKLASHWSTAENGRVHQRYEERFQDEFDEKNKQPAYLGLGEKRTLNGQRVSKGEYGAAKSSYVAEKMEQYSDEIIQKEKEYLLDAFKRTPRDLGFIEAYIYDSGVINDEIIQISTELFENADNEVRDEYLEKEKVFKDVYDEFRKENDTPTNQQKRWDFLLPDELDSSGEPTGQKVPFLATGTYNPSFVARKREIWNEVKDARAKASDLYIKYADNNDRYEQEYKQAVKEKNEAEDKYYSWREKNTVKKNGDWVPTDKWKMESQELNETQHKIRGMVLGIVNEIQEMYPKAGELKSEDRHIGEFIRLPNVPKGTIEKFTDGSLYENTLETMKEIINPRQDDIGYESISQETVKSTRDNKYHPTVPIYYRGDIKDQSFDVLSSLLMDYHMALNYKKKRGIESEILALKDIAMNREVSKTKSILGKGVKEMTNFFNEELNIELDSEQEISKRFKTLRSLIQARMYGIERKGNEKINKLVDNLVSATSLSILPLNVFSAVSNVTMGKATSLVEMFGDNVPLQGRDLLFGEKEYMRHLPGSLADAAKPKVDGFMQKLMEKYDVLGDFHGPTFRFSEDSRFKQLFSRGTLYALQSGTENYIGGTLAIAGLNSMKLQNKSGEYINQDGEIVNDRNEAASMYDYLKIQDGELVFKELQGAYKTDNFNAELGSDKHNKLTKNFIRDLVAQTQGQYDSKSHSVIETSMFGRMFSNLRHWMFRGLDRNWRGASYIFKDEIPEEAKLRSRQGGADTIGYQTQLFNTVWKTKKGLWKYASSMMKEGERLKFDIVSKPWKDLSASERSRVRKAVTQYALAGIAFVTARVLKGLDDDEEEIPDSMIHLTYALTRAKQELMFYSNPMETLRILRSPAASVSMVRDVIRLTEQAATDMLSGEFDRYQRTRFKGETKLGKQIGDIIPVYSQFQRDVRSTLEYIETMSADQ